MITEINYTYDTKTQQVLHKIGWKKMGIGGALFMRSKEAPFCVSEDNALYKSLIDYDIDLSIPVDEQLDQLSAKFDAKATPIERIKCLLRDIKQEINKNPVSVDTVNSLINQALNEEE